MKTILLSLALSIMSLFVFATKPHIETVAVDAKSSIVKWIGSKISSSHEGNVNIGKGVLSINHGTLVGGQISINMNSISCTDIESAKKNKYFVDHMKDEDFFNTEVFPLALLKITKTVKGKGNNYKIIADLTIKGITHSIAFLADVEIDGLNFSAKANLEIDRTKWGIKYGSGSFFDNLGDKMILDEIEFQVLLQSVK